MATASGTYTDCDQDNFFRMNILIVDFALKVLQDVLQEELRKKYPNLFNPYTGMLCGVLSDANVRKTLFGLSPKVFNHYQRNQLYPNGNSSPSVTVGDLDLTLTVLLLRNITSLNPCPRNAWDNPSDTDTTTEASIGRVKRYRNTVFGHANKAAISEQDFKAHFSGLKSILLGLSGRFTNEDYDAILSKPLDAELFKKYQDIMEEWRDNENDVKETIEAGFERISEKFTEGITQVQSELQKLSRGQDEDVQTEIGSEVQSVAQAHVPERKHTRLEQRGRIQKWKRKKRTPELKTKKSKAVEKTSDGSDAMPVLQSHVPEKKQVEKTADPNKLHGTTPGTLYQMHISFQSVISGLINQAVSSVYQEPVKSPTLSRKSPIAAFYTHHMSQIQRLPWDPNDTMHIDEVYVNLEWVKEEKKPEGDSFVPIQNYTSIFENTKQGETPKRILVRGKAGIGKTTFTQKMATDWANVMLGKKCDRMLLKYKNLLILNLRSIQPAQTLKEAIEMQIPCSEKEINEIMDALDIDSDHVLLVFDGYDEYDPKTSKEITDIIHRRRHQDVCTIITTRPWKAEELMNLRITDSVYEITGLTDKNIAEYIAKFFGEEASYAESLDNLKASPLFLDKEAMYMYDECLKLQSEYESWQSILTGEEMDAIGKGLVGYLRQKRLVSLVKIPTLLLFICLLWQEDQRSEARTESLPASYTLLYKKLIQLLIRRKYNTKTQDETDKYSKTIEKTLNSLGRLAYYGLLKPEGGLIFDEKDLQSVPDIGEMYSLGLLSKSKVHYNLDVKQAVTFPHKTIQEFFAAKYLAGTLDIENSHLLGQFLERFHTTDELYNMDYVLRFLCGLSEMATVKVLERAKALQVISRNHRFLFDLSNMDIKWCNNILLEHWYAHCTQETVLYARCTQATVLPPELFSWHTTLNIPDSFRHPDPGFQQVLCDTAHRASKSPQKYSGMFKDVRAVKAERHFPSLKETEQHIFSFLNTCDTFQELLTINWSIEDTTVLHHVLSIAPKLNTLGIVLFDRGILSSIPNLGKLEYLRATKIHINGEDILKFGQMTSLKRIGVESVVVDRSQDLHSTLVNMFQISYGLIEIELKGTCLSARGVKLLAQNFHRVPGLKTLQLSDVFRDSRSNSDMISMCGANRCTCPGDNDTTKHDRCQDVCEAVFELSQGVKHNTMLEYFLFGYNHLGRYHGITSPLISLIQSLCTVSKQTGMPLPHMVINMDGNDLDKVDRLNDLKETIVNSYEYVKIWLLQKNHLANLPKGTWGCTVYV